MPRVDFDKAVTSNYSGQADYSIDAKDTDGVQVQKETKWDNPNWTKYWGIFTSVGDVYSALIMKSVWSTGKGWTADSRTTAILDGITGWGDDTFDDIIFNADLIKNVGGDSYAHVIRNDKTGILINLKPLNPGKMSTVLNPDGLIIRHEQRKENGKIKKFRPEQIFHLSNNRLADQTHGISDIDALEKTILAEQESFDDMQKLQHFQVKPFIIFKMKTDNQTKINAFVKKVEEGRKYSEDLFIPDDEDLLSWEVIQINPSSVIMEWRNDLKNKYYRLLGLPEIIFGTTGATESGGKMEMFGHEQVFEYNQRYLEKQIWNQLALKIDLIPPTSLSQNLQADEKKDAGQGLELQKSDVSANTGA